jgi:two-component system chemotaxis response regulator CheY
MALILVVDDDQIDRMIVESLLRLDGHEMVFAEDGTEALELYKQHRCDVVVTDLVMPKANGLRLIQDLLEFDPQARIVAITGSSPGPLFLAERYGAVAILTKPLQRDPFLSAVAAAARLP